MASASDEIEYERRVLNEQDLIAERLVGRLGLVFGLRWNSLCRRQQYQVHTYECNTYRPPSPLVF